MAGQFCMSCGTALPADAKFCAKCGNPIGGPSTALPSNVASPISAGPTVGGANPASLSEILGLRGQRKFLVQHQMLSLGHSYRVMDPEKRHLFTVKGNTGQNLAGNALGNLVGGGGYMGRLVARSVSMTYTLVDPGEVVRGVLTKEGGANSSTFTLSDTGGQPIVSVKMERGLMGGITATAVYPDGRPMLQTHGNLLRHDFLIKDPSGGDVAKVHEAWVAVRDTYDVDMLSNIDPLYPLVYAVLIDFEKVK